MPTCDEEKILDHLESLHDIILIQKYENPSSPVDTDTYTQDSERFEVVTLTDQDNLTLALEVELTIKPSLLKPKIIFIFIALIFYLVLILLIYYFAC